MKPQRIVCLLALLLPLAAAAETLKLDPKATRVTFTLDSPLHLVEGSFQLREGEVRFDPRTGAAAGRIVVDARTGETRNSSRDKKMHGQVLESVRFPEIVFVPDHFEGTLPESGAGQVKLRGVLSLHGGDHPMTLPATIRRDHGRLRAELSFAVPFIQWGLKDPSLPLLKVDREVKVKIDARGTLSPG
jgi:polyisoprenoid-binding protein YceI